MRPLPLRTALATTAVGCLVALYLLWWTSYAGIHFNQRFAQQPPGVPAKAGGTSIRVLSMTRSDLLGQPAYGDEPKQAGPGATWVVAELEAVQQPGAPNFYCTLELVGPDRRHWDKKSSAGRTVPDCDTDELKSGRPLRFETIFLVPDRFADQIAGVALMDPTVPDRVPVITPPV
jgi:hypothetical protein